MNQPIRLLGGGNQARPIRSVWDDAAVTDAEGAFGPLLDTRLRVLTWNLWWQFGPWRQREPAIVETIRRLDPDVVGLQEVWRTGEGAGADGSSLRIARALGLHEVYESRVDFDGVAFGNAVLSRWPIAGHEAVALPAPDTKQEFRTILRADIDGPGGPIQLFTTHLNWRLDESAVRQDQARELVEFVARSPARTYPAVICGDFNADPDADEIRMLTGKAAGPVDRYVFHDAWAVAGDGGPGSTWSNRNPYARLDLEPDRRIDYVFAGWPKQGGAGNIVSAQVVGDAPVEGVHPSDHYGVLAELRY
jgi:endonuclease/exonuclease/phosphatase family metal-dependent hydrolase